MSIPITKEMHPLPLGTLIQCLQERVQEHDDTLPVGWVGKVISSWDHGGVGWCYLVENGVSKEQPEILSAFLNERGELDDPSKFVMLEPLS